MEDILNRSTAVQSTTMVFKDQAVCALFSNDFPDSKIQKAKLDLEQKLKGSNEDKKKYMQNLCLLFKEHESIFIMLSRYIEQKYKTTAFFTHFNFNCIIEKIILTIILSTHQQNNYISKKRNKLKNEMENLEKEHIWAYNFFQSIGRKDLLDFKDMDLFEENLEYSRLDKLNFSSTNFRRVNFNQVTMKRTRLDNADLSLCENLDAYQLSKARFSYDKNSKKANINVDAQDKLNNNNCINAVFFKMERRKYIQEKQKRIQKEKKLAEASRKYEALLQKAKR
ncbi:MAG: pentapeptide repeat-containing protein [Gammaproteobacteria bacterium]